MGSTHQCRPSTGSCNRRATAPAVCRTSQADVLVDRSWVKLPVFLTRQNVWLFWNTNINLINYCKQNQREIEQTCPILWVNMIEQWTITYNNNIWRKHRILFDFGQDWGLDRRRVWPTNLPDRRWSRAVPNSCQCNGLQTWGIYCTILYLQKATYFLFGYCNI